jgi:hypothetical protein
MAKTKPKSKTYHVEIEYTVSQEYGTSTLAEERRGWLEAPPLGSDEEGVISRVKVKVTEIK